MCGHRKKNTCLLILYEKQMNILKKKITFSRILWIASQNWQPSQMKVGEWGKGNGGSGTGRLFHDHQNGAEFQNLVSFLLNYILRPKRAYAPFIKTRITQRACRGMNIESFHGVWATPKSAFFLWTVACVTAKARTDYSLFLLGSFSIFLPCEFSCV